MTLRSRLQKLESHTPLEQAVSLVLVRIFDVGADRGEFGHASVPGGVTLSRGDDETEPAFLKRVYRTIRVSKPIEAMTDDELQVWIAGESEEAAFALAEEKHLPGEFLKKFADFKENQNKHEQ